MFNNMVTLEGFIRFAIAGLLSYLGLGVYGVQLLGQFQPLLLLS